MDYMKPLASAEAPTGGNWAYEVKYDGFRAQLHWHADSIQLISRNGHDITALFPEVMGFCSEREHLIKTLLPVILDGELAVLNHQYQANFSLIQQRGRMKNLARVEKAAKMRPATFLAFDMLQQNAESLKNVSFLKRKQNLSEMFTNIGHRNEIDQRRPLTYIPAHHDSAEIWKRVTENKGEGMIAKRTESTYLTGKNHQDWFKIKNWRHIEGILTFYNLDNGYFTVEIYDNNDLLSVGKCKHGLNTEEADTLKTLFTENGTKEQGGYTLPPALCARINTLDLFKNELREPNFAEILPHVKPEECTRMKMDVDMAMFPQAVDISNTDKLFWPEEGLTKGNLLIFIREVAPYMLPFLEGKTLTVIRAPDGVEAETFFQKRLPDYAPSYINSIENEGENLIVVDHLDALVWFANHGAIEYHTPFEKAGNSVPSEIVFDLDPPDVDRFPLAIQAALMLKQLLDDLGLVSFVKTSGNKGMQVHIPLPEASMSYDETAILTKAIAETMVNAHSELFTIERMKKDRDERLYIDYVQHAPEKTIIAPYSPRLTASGTVATPLYWHEVNEKLRPDQFTIQNVVNRVQTIGCPFTPFFEAGKNQQLHKIKNMLSD